MNKIDALKELLKERKTLQKDITWAMSDYTEKYGLREKLKNVEEKISEVGNSLSKDELINLILQ